MAGDIVTRLARIQEDIRRLKLRPTRTEMPFTVSQSFIVGGEISSDLYIPPHILGMDRFNHAGLDGVERKFIVDIRHRLRVGTASITWYRSTLTTFTSGSLPLEVFDDYRIRPQITSASADAEDLTATFTIAYFPDGGGPS